MTLYERYESEIINAIDKALGASWWHNLSVKKRNKLTEEILTVLQEVLLKWHQNYN